MSDPTITKYLLGSAVMASQVLTSVLHIQKYKKYKCSFSYMCGMIDFNLGQPSHPQMYYSIVGSDIQVDEF